MGLRYSIRHLIVIAFFVLCMSILWIYHQLRARDINCFAQYGYWCFLLYSIRILNICVSLDWSFRNAAGIMGFELFPNKKNLRQPIISNTQIDDFHLVFRVVTRGLYPSLVKTTLKKNQTILCNLGLKNYTIEIVTDQKLDIANNQYVRQVVVPERYTTSNGSLFKARALQYCLEPQIDRLCANDWIIHLDEETLLTEGSVLGILEFIRKGKESIGQGVITYANEEIVNWITTLSDLKRIGVDYGIIRYCLKTYQSSPIMKGSFLVVKLSTELDISFDFRPEKCITEDMFFCHAAVSKGYKMGFIDGEMWEKSTFSIADFIRQRRRWFKGLIGHCHGGSLINLIFHFRNFISIMVSFPNIIIHFFFPLYFPHYIIAPMVFIISTTILMYVVSAVKSFPVDIYGYFKTGFLYIAAVLIIPVGEFLEAVGSLAGWMSINSLDFYIVDKNVHKALSHKNNM